MADLWKPVPLPDGAYADDSKQFSDQDVVNLWVEYAEGEGTRSPKKLVQLPGLRPWTDFGAGPHRAIRNVEGNLFCVADTHAYWVKSATEVVQLGEIPGRGRCWISHNQITNGSEVMFSTGADAWIYNTVDETFTKVTDEAFRGARSLIYLNSRFLGIEQQRRFFANSALADGQSWDSLERYEAESAPDRLVALIDYGGEVYAFNERTLEIFQNTTNPDDIANHILFTRIGSPVEVGAASPHAVSRLDNRIFLVGSDGQGYYMSGYNPVCITTPAIATAWQECDLSKAFAFTYEAHGHKVWYVTFPDGHTWGYDCLSSARAGRPIWHRRETIGLDRWRLNTLCQWDGRWIGGAYNSGILYEVDWTYHGLEGCDEIERYFIPGVLHDEGNRVTLNGLRIECDTGNGATDCEAAAAVVPDGLYEALVMESSPIAWWPLQDTSAALATELIGGYVGEYTGSVTLSDTVLRRGASAAAKFTNGCMRTTATLPPDFDPTLEWTVESWFKMTDFATSGGIEAMFYAAINDSNLGYMNMAQGLYFNGANDYRLQMHYNEETTHTSRTVRDSSSVVLDTVCHFVSTFDPAATPKFVIYLNGVQVATANPTLVSATADPCGAVRIGGHEGYPLSYNFVGVLSDVILYRTALSPETVLAHYEAGSL